MTILLVVAAIGLAILTFGKSIGGAISSYSSSVEKIAQAIAVAEGFYVSGSRPQRNHNPGDMTQDLVGLGVGRDGQFIVYANDQDGWACLYKQIGMWLDGSSSHADASFTISDISHFYTTDNQTAWATNVANQLGVGLDTPIGEIS
jgi:hypothetical protein